MGLLELFILATGLSMDAFAVAVCAGLTMPVVSVRKAMIIGLYFGFFQAVMPLIGYLAATWFADNIVSYDHWVAVVLLSVLGGKMIAGSFKKKRRPGRKCPDKRCNDESFPGSGEISLKPAKMLPLSIAVSIDALAVGVSLAFLQTGIVFAVLFIGVTTLLLSMAGVKLGNIFGAKLKSKAEFAGGVILVLIGVRIFLEHTL